MEANFKSYDYSKKNKPKIQRLNKDDEESNALLSKYEGGAKSSLRSKRSDDDKEGDRDFIENR